jgi:hypothetical protein
VRSGVFTVQGGLNGSGGMNYPLTRANESQTQRLVVVAIAVGQMKSNTKS